MVVDERWFEKFQWKSDKAKEMLPLWASPDLFLSDKSQSKRFFESLEIGDDDVDRVASSSHSHILTYIRRRPAMFSYINTALKRRKNTPNAQTGNKTTQQKMLQERIARCKTIFFH